ncbi:hypothetical protein IAR50_005983 [Cryptococcus sp. DSM 104548]
MSTDCLPSATSSATFPTLTTPPSLTRDLVPVIRRATGGEADTLDSLMAEGPHSSLPLPSSHNFLPYLPSSTLDQYHFPAKRPLSPRASRRAASPVKRVLPPPSLSPEIGRPRKKSKMMDMNMARSGSMAALPSIQTPLATYAAQMVVWLWYGQFQTHPPSPISPSTPSSISIDPFDPNTQPQRISQLMVQPSPEFHKFAARLLQVTMVSHSVTLVSLLYVYRLKTRNAFFSTPGSEHRPFVAALMLANKYLDDNTYTNATWSELAGIALPEINQMETEFLAGLGYELGVELDEYERWKMLLDEFMRSRGPGGSMAPSRRQPSPLGAHTISTPTFSSRARSASPVRLPQPYEPSGRKRSAADAFHPDTVPPPFSGHGMLRVPSNTSQPLVSSRSRPTLSREPSSSSLARSASWNRQLARLPSHYGRRGSAGHVYPTPSEPMQYQQPSCYGQPVPASMQHDWDGGRALLAPYDENLPQPQLVPQEHLMFYSLAAEARPGADGQPRKAILRYQAPTPQHHYGYPQSYHGYQAPPPPPSDVSMTGSVSPMYQYPTHAQTYTPNPYATSHWSSPIDIPQQPEPAQFANAGPPGYWYNPYAPSPEAWNGGDRRMSAGWVRGPDGMVYYPGQPAGYPPMTSRSEWSSPIPRCQ